MARTNEMRYISHPCCPNSCRNLNTELNYLAFGSIGPIPRPLGDIPPNNLNPAFDHLAANLPASLASPQER